MPYIHTYNKNDQERYREVYQDEPGKLLHIDEAEAARIKHNLDAFYQQQLTESGMDGYVIGLSGGVDSTTVAHLLVDAVGAEHVTPVILPPPHAKTTDIEPARLVAQDLGLEPNKYEQFQDKIGSVVDALIELGEAHSDDAVQRLKRGNILARCRMIVIRDIAKANKALVAGTTNASERDLGYMTLAADGLGGIDNEGLYELYKTTERDLASHIGVPTDIVERTPTADLWPGQKDADELGFSYTVLDKVLIGFRLGVDTATIADTIPAVSSEEISLTKKRVEQNAFKNKLPPHPGFA